MNIPHATQSLRRFLRALLVLQLLTLAASFWFWQQPLLQEAGAWMGKLAIYFLWLSVLPGILSRFQVKGWAQQLQVVLMTNRRWLGITMFQFAILHYFWSSVFQKLPVILAGAVPDLPLFEIFGMLTFGLLLPLYLTSNDVSVQLLKRNWKRVHALIYVAMWTATAHVVLQPPITFVVGGVAVGLDYTLSYGIPSLLLIGAQLASFVVWRRRRQVPQVPTTSA